MLFPVIPLLPYFFSALFFINSFLSFLLHLNLSSFLHHSLSLFLSLLTLFSLPFSFSFHSFVYFPLFSTAFHCLSLFSIPLFFSLWFFFKLIQSLFFQYLNHPFLVSLSSSVHSFVFLHSCNFLDLILSHFRFFPHFYILFSIAFITSLFSFSFFLIVSLSSFYDFFTVLFLSHFYILSSITALPSLFPFIVLLLFLFFPLLFPFLPFFHHFYGYRAHSLHSSNSLYFHFFAILFLFSVFSVLFLTAILPHLFRLLYYLFSFFFIVSSSLVYYFKFYRFNFLLIVITFPLP